MNLELINQYKIVNKLKSTYRTTAVGDRFENSAEHTWGVLMLAEFFLPQIDEKLNKQRIMELILYHDLVEAYTGDVPFLPGQTQDDKYEKEEQAAKQLAADLPESMRDPFMSAFTEYELQESVESHFAKACDVIEPLINELDSDKNWKRTNRAFIEEHKKVFVSKFPVILEAFTQVLDFAQSKGYFIEPK
ncbi:MAG: putative hydrolase of HD superfamily [Candidatus Woesearchaeota archaeon]|jgi:putative hydrolase of HD superfamily